MVTADIEAIAKAGLAKVRSAFFPGRRFKIMTLQAEKAIEISLNGLYFMPATTAVYPVFAEAPSEAEGEVEGLPHTFAGLPHLLAYFARGWDFDFLLNKMSRIPILRQHRAKGWGNLQETSGNLLPKS